jgi:hypothetical protein
MIRNLLLGKAILPSTSIMPSTKYQRVHQAIQLNNIKSNQRQQQHCRWLAWTGRAPSSRWANGQPKAMANGSWSWSSGQSRGKPHSYSRKTDKTIFNILRGGLLLWLGQPAANATAEEATSEAFLLLELVQGRVRAAVQLGPGHWPPSQLFSLSPGPQLVFCWLFGIEKWNRPFPVNDGSVHRLRLRLQGQRLFLTLDQLPIQTILNSGPQPQFPAGPLQLFLGGFYFACWMELNPPICLSGMPAELARRALVQLQLSDPSSIRGQLKAY